jgi:hypothetical protein
LNKIGDAYTESITKRQDGTIQVTQEDIDKSQLAATTLGSYAGLVNPVGLALQRALGGKIDNIDDVDVNSYVIIIYWRDTEEEICYDTPSEARSFMEKWTGGYARGEMHGPGGASQVEPTELSISFKESPL